ncbi:TPA: XRE family transcriptional regulator, partial [Enterococcus faecium]|nr:XRE family transcriptional regulator [Enterococcus faecium]
YVLIRKQESVEDGEIAAVRVNGDEEATLKRIKRQGNIVMLVADNKEYDPYIITEDNPATIIGKAVKISIDL